jgi:hypothetical protein
VDIAGVNHSAHDSPSNCSSGVSIFRPSAADIKGPVGERFLPWRSISRKP